MIPSDLFASIRVRIMDKYIKDSIMPHICNYLGVLSVMEGNHHIHGDHKIKHTFDVDELQGESEFSENAQILLKKIILEDNKDYGFIKFPLIKNQRETEFHKPQQA